MSTETKKSLVPKLRFPEFRGAEGWQTEPMGNVYSFKGNNSLSRDKLNYVTGPVNNIHYGDIHTKFASHFDITQELVPFINVSELGVVREDNFSEEGDMVFADASEDMADIGKSVEIVRLNGQRLVSGLHTILACRTDERIALGFGGHLFKSGWIRTQIQKEAQGAKVLGISATRLRNLRLSLPKDRVEQQKIADCLSSLDELIAAQARKVEALKTHKKGLMQQLFPIEGETQPRLRFPEFLNAGDWEMKSLGSFSKVGDIDHKMPLSTAHGIPYIMTGDFFGMNDIDYENAKKISIADYEQLSKKIKPELGDIIIARYASVGAVRYIQTRLKFLVSYSCAIIKCNKSEDSRYIYYAFQSDVIQSQIRLEINTSSQKNIGIDSIKKIKFFLPTLSEQLKISACLAVLDAQITAATQELDTLKTHKKGLMQQLFPSMELVHA